MKYNKWITPAILLLVVPATLLLGTRLPERLYYLTGTLMILEILVPFFLTFEGRRPQARELALMAVLCALAVAARVALPIPNFKAIYGVLMIVGIALGPEPGFLVGAIAALVSNFFRGQGPHTPWQMLAYGICAMLAGYLFAKERLPRKPLVMGIVGFVSIVVLIGPILDTCSLFLMSVSVSYGNAAAIYGYGLTVNISQGISTFLVLFLLGNPLLGKIQRIRHKYGMLAEENPDM